MHAMILVYLHSSNSFLVCFYRGLSDLGDIGKIAFTWVNGQGYFSSVLGQEWVGLLTNDGLFLFKLLCICVNKINYDHFGRKVKHEATFIHAKASRCFLCSKNSGERLLFENLCNFFLSHFLLHSCPQMLLW